MSWQRRLSWQRPREAIRLALLVCLWSMIGAAQGEVAQGGTVDVARSRIYVFVGKTGAGHEHAVEGVLSKGELDLKQQNAGSLTFDLKSLSADTAAARKVLRLAGETDASTRGQVTANMLSATVLDTAKFPTAEFQVQKVQVLPADPKQPGDRYQLDGELTLHGVKRPVRLNVGTDPVDGLTRMRGTLELKQTHFGIRPYTKLFGAVGVTDELRVYGEIWIRP
jgi:polyisoprenoid-binding protein YceI